MQPGNDDRSQGIDDSTDLAPARVGAVVDHAGLLHAESILDVIRQGRALHAVIGEPPEERRPTALGEITIGRRRSDRDQAGLIEDGSSRLGLARPRRADQTDDR